VTGVDLHALSQMVGRQLPLLSLVVPFYLVVLMAGWRGLRDVWPAAIVSGGTFAIAQCLTANYLGPMLPDIISSVVSILALVMLLRVWHPAESFRFASEEKLTTRPVAPPLAKALAAWAPFLILTLMVGGWGVKSVQALLDQVTIRMPVPGLDGAIVNPDTGRAIAAVFRFNWLGASGTAVCLAALFSAAVLGAGWRLVATVAVDTGCQLARSVATIAAFLAFAYVSSASGMTTTLGRALAGTGALFPFFSPLLGWLGVFITGSDTSANALFGRLQQVSADQLGLSPVLTVAANSSGGVTAKMISPQSIAVACAATGQVGKEPDLVRFTLPHSLIMVALLGAMTLLQATWFAWMVPAAAPATAAAAASHSPAQAFGILGAIALVVVILGVLDRRVRRS
jgi:lactate permease